MKLCVFDIKVKSKPLLLLRYYGAIAILHSDAITDEEFFCVFIFFYYYLKYFISFTFLLTYFTFNFCYLSSFSCLFYLFFLL